MKKKKSNDTFAVINKEYGKLKTKLLKKLKKEFDAIFNDPVLKKRSLVAIQFLESKFLESFLNQVIRPSLQQTHYLLEEDY